jgi:hypothetical protein
MIHAVPPKRLPKPLGVVADRCDAGRMSAMRRRLSTLFFVASVLMWIVAIGVYIRSRFRADAITWVTASHHCLFLKSADGTLTCYDQSRWPGPSQMQWSTGPPDYNIFAQTQRDTLLGPPIAWVDIRDPNMKVHAWKRLGIQYGTAWLDLPAEIDVPIRDPYGFYADFSPSGDNRKLNVNGLWIPTWILPSLLTILPALWSITIGRRRYRAHSRRRRGLCIHCGYDLRHTPLRCPECGVQVVNKHPSAID